MCLRFGLLNRVHQMCSLLKQNVYCDVKYVEPLWFKVTVRQYKKMLEDAVSHKLPDIPVSPIIIDNRLIDIRCTTSSAPMLRTNLTAVDIRV